MLPREGFKAKAWGRLVVAQFGVAPTPQGGVGILGLCRAKQTAEKRFHAVIPIP
jgi:hypothetical protein